jgi:hypothetical protein
MATSRAWTFALCLAVSGLFPGTAAAQGKGDTTKSADDKDKDKEKEKARGYIKTGNKAAFAGKWEDAYADYAIAWSMAPDWETAYPVGKAAFKTGHFAEAFARLTFHLKNAPADQVPAKQRNDVEAMIEEAKSKTGALTIKADEGAEILVDNEMIGRAPLTEAIHLDPGTHKVESRRGSTGESKTVEIAAGGSVDVSFIAPKVKPTATPTATAPVVKPPISGPLRIVGLATGGALTLGGLVVGGVGIAIASQKGTEKEKARDDLEGRDAFVAAASAEAQAQNTMFWGFVGAGIAAAATVGFYFATRPSEKAQVKAGVGVQSGGPAIWMQGQF